MTYPWSCLLDAFSRVLDIPAGLIEKWIEHDGGEVIWPQLREPLCRRGFHIQELIDFCFANGYWVTPIDALPSCKPTNDIKIESLYIYNNSNAVKRLRKYMKNTKGVLTGQTLSGNRHAIAWVNNDVLDPARKIFHVNDFRIETYWIISNQNEMSSENT